MQGAEKFSTVKAIVMYVDQKVKSRGAENLSVPDTSSRYR